MTYQKVIPIWRTSLKPVSAKMPITQPLELDYQSGLRAPFNTPTDLCNLLSRPRSQAAMSSIAADSFLLELHALALAKDMPLSATSMHNSPTTADYDDDYDHCDEYENGFGDFDTEDLFTPAAAQSHWGFDESSAASSDSEDEDEDETDEESFSFDLDVSLVDDSDDSSSPRPELCDLPHWWGEEDQEHMAEVVAHYDHIVAITAEKRNNIRAAAPFVGRIVRHQVPSSDSLQSLDEVSIYRYELIPFGQTMPLIRTHWVLTNWDPASGLPLRQALVSNRVANTVWLPIARNTHITTIFCEPDASCPSTFVYTSDRDGLHRDSIFIGYFNSSNSWSRFFPESAFHHVLPEGD